MLPKIIFRNSWLYDQALIRKGKVGIPSDAVYAREIKILECSWNKYGRQVLHELERITGLTWHEREIVCYMTSGVIPFSDPATVSLRPDREEMLQTVIHELIHRIFSEKENFSRIKKWWFNGLKSFGKEAPLTKTHIYIHAIHEHILCKYFPKRLKIEKRAVKHKAYVRAWEIVDERGYKNIIRLLNPKYK